MPAAYGEDLRWRAIWYSQIAQQTCEGESRISGFDVFVFFGDFVFLDESGCVRKLTNNLHVVLC